MIKAQPKSVGSLYPERYEGKYTDKATITAVEVVKSDRKPELNGCLAIHLKGKITYDNGTTKQVELVDWFGKKSKNTDKTSFAQQMLNRAVNAQLSAGEKPFSDEIDEDKVRGTVKKIFEGLIGKQVTANQYFKRNKDTGEFYTKPNINYLFGENAEVGEIENDDDVEDLPL